jgi:hypothetical protein
MVPHPLSNIAKGGKRMQSKALPNPMSLSPLPFLFTIDHKADEPRPDNVAVLSPNNEMSTVHVLIMVHK